VAQLSIAQPVLAPRIWYGIGTADRNVHAAKLKVDEAKRTILISVANAIVAVVTAERVAEVNRVGLKSALQRLELTQRRQRLGAGTTLDVVRAEQDVTLARSTLIAGDESLRQAREALGLALGSRESFGVSPNISLNAIERELGAMCARGTPDQRSDVLAARADVEVAERGVTDVKLAYAPLAEVSSTGTYSSEELINGKNYAWSIQGVLTIPIWDGGARYGEMRSARATLAEQKARLEAAQRGSTVEATQALRSISVAEQARQQSEKARDLARENARLSQVAFDAGTVTSFELIEAARRQRETELDLAVREFDLVKARIAALLAASYCRN
jgi:outer membrane protein TolC